MLDTHTVRQAIRNGEIKPLLTCERNRRPSNAAYAPVNLWTSCVRTVPEIYRIYRETNDESVAKAYEKALETMFIGIDPNDIYFGLALLYHELLGEKAKVSPFHINRAYFAKLAEQTLAKRMFQLRETRPAWGTTMWGEISKYREALNNDFGMTI